MHKTVLLKESVEVLEVEEGDVIADATLGVGGHSIELAKLVGEKGKVIVFDIDPKAIEEFQNRIEKDFPELKSRFESVNDNFANISERVRELGFSETDGVLADLGWRIEQIENEEYGMSFMKEAPLDMRMGDRSEGSLNASEIINSWDEQQLADLFWKYGEERNSRKAARAIVEARTEKKIETTKELGDILAKRLGSFYRKSRIHPATKIFQALRIEVNNEFDNLEKFLDGAKEILKPEGRIAVISFHSLEDRIVKSYFRSNTGGCVCPKGIPICVCGAKAVLKIITKKPIVPTTQELEANPRARSAKLRVAEKI